MISLILFLLPLLSASAELPDTQACCRRNGLSEHCSSLLCDSSVPPSGLKFFKVAENCSEALPVAASCLADGRNQTQCCLARAEDAEQNACMDLCEGSAAPSLTRSNWGDNYDAYRQYMLCMTLNLASIYQCFREGYLRNPAPPTDIKAEVESPTAVKISWEKPARAAEFAQQFLLFFEVQHNASSEATGEMRQQFLTTDTVKMVEGLKPDTQYKAYVVSSTKDGERLSLKSSPARFVTAGVPPQVQPYKSLVYGSEGHFQTLVCKVQVAGLEKRDLAVVWQHKRPGAQNFETLNYDGGDKYNLVAYLSDFDRKSLRKSYVSALTIRHISSDDFGTYSCLARSKFGAGAAEIDFVRKTSVNLPSGPPNMKQCCERVGVSRDCIQGCQGTAEGKPANAGRYWSQPNCVLEIPKLLSCSLDGVDQGSCCLRRRVPFQCLPFCDGGMDLRGFSFLHMLQCLPHTTDILNCQEEVKVSLPEVPRNLRVSEAGTELTVQWDSAERASLYHLYYRPEGRSDWDRKTVTETETSLSSAQEPYELVVVAANSVGLSGTSKTLVWPFSRLRDEPIEGSEEDQDQLRVGTGRLQQYVAHSNSEE